MGQQHLSFSVTEGESGRKIEEFLKQNGCSHHVLTHLKRTDHGIILNGEWAYSSMRLQCGDVLELWIREEEASDQIIPTPLPLNIVYEDEDLMVIKTNRQTCQSIHQSTTTKRLWQTRSCIISGKREKLLCTAA